jgi:hypothetical protein
MNHHAVTAVLLLVLAVGCERGEAPGTVVEFGELPAKMRELLKRGDAEKTYRVTVGGDESLSVRLEATNKGNGTLSIPGLRIKIADFHDDGCVYDGGVLTIHAVGRDDLGRGGLVISGTALVTDDGSSVARRVVVGGIYRLDPRTMKYAVEAEHSPSWLSMPQ